MNIEQAQAKKDLDIKLPSLEQPPEILGQDAIQDTKNFNKMSLVLNSFEATNTVQLSFAWESHKYNRDFLNNADKKAQSYVAFATTFLIWMHESGNYTPLWSLTLENWRLYDVISAISIFMLCSCIFLSLLVLKPDLKGSRKGLIYFGSIAEYENKDDYLSDVSNKNEQGIKTVVLQHVYELAKVCNQKFQKLKLSLYGLAELGLRWA